MVSPILVNTFCLPLFSGLSCDSPTNNFHLLKVLHSLVFRLPTLWIIGYANIHDLVSIF